jgi:hypothetical protein
MNRTELRHRMLTEIATARPLVLDCVNVKRAVWKARRQHNRQFNLSAGESRAVNDLLWTYAHTPYWQGEMDVLRVVEPTGEGVRLLADWDEKFGPVDLAAVTS